MKKVCVRSEEVVIDWITACKYSLPPPPTLSVECTCLSESRLCHTLVFINAVWADMMWIENVNMLVRFCWSFIPVIAVRRACPKYSLILWSGLQGYICFWIHLLHTEANLNAIGIVQPSPPWPHPVAEEPQTADSTWARRTGNCFKFWGISYTPLL